MELVRRSLKVRIAATAVAVAVLGLVGGYAGDGGTDAKPSILGGFELQTHKSGHPAPPGCTKQHQYGKQPEQKCQNHNP